MKKLTDEEKTRIIAGLFEHALMEIAALDELHLGWGPVIAKQMLEKAKEIE